MYSLILGGLHHCNSMALFMQTLFALEAKCLYWRTRQTSGACLYPAAERGAKITDVHLSKLVGPHEAVQCQRYLLSARAQASKAWRLC